MIAFGFMLAFAGIILLITVAAQAWQNRFYATGSEIAIGMVTRKHTRKLKNGTAYLLTVTYMVDGTTYEKVVGAQPTEYQDINIGDNLELRYKTANPKKAIRPMVLNPRNMRVVWIIGAVLIVAGAVLCFIAINQSRRLNN